MTLTCTCHDPATHRGYCPMHGCPHDDRAHCDCREQMHAAGLVPRNAQQQVRFGDGATISVDESVDMVNHPPHYNNHPSGVECIDITRHLSCCMGNAVKYVFRAPYKGTEHQDLDKARFYLEDAIGHADPIYLPSYSFRTGQLLDRVCDHETEHNRWVFFRSVKIGNLHQCLISTKAMLAGT